MPPVGKSGPLMIFTKSSMVASGLSINRLIASINSVKLWGGITVDMPTAIPMVPLSNKLGNLAGRTAGSFKESSKFGFQFTVSFSKSNRISSAMPVNLASV